jgi:uncharacterized protein YqgV (UPF0045/DUF77 family)
MKGSIAIQILPRVEKDKVFEAVDRVIEYIQSTGLTYHVGPFETTIEGNFEELIDIIKRAHELTIEAGVSSVSSYIKTSFTNEEEFWSIDEKIGKYNK